MSRGKNGRLIYALLRPCCRPYPSCFRRRNSPCRSSRVWKHVPIWTYVRAHEGVEEVASEDQPGAEVRSNAMFEGVYGADNVLDALQRPPPSPRPPSLLSSSLAATKSPPSQKFLSSSPPKPLRALPLAEPLPLSSFFRPSVQAQMSAKSVPLGNYVPERESFEAVAIVNVAVL